MKKLKRLGDILIEAGLITEENLSEILKLQRTTNKRLGELLISEGIVTEKQIIEVLEYQLGISHVVLSKVFIESDIPRLIPEAVARRYVLIPIARAQDTITVAMSDPLNIYAHDDILIATGLKIIPVLASPIEIINAIDLHYGKQRAEKAIEEFKNEYTVEMVNDMDEEDMANINSAPIVKLVNGIITQAVKSRASDIHIEPYETFLRVRYRVDGELIEIMTPSRAAQSAIVTRIKIMAKLDISEKRLPQDGRIELNIDGRDIDLRISTLPTVYGEKVVMRLLDRSNFITSKRMIGLSDKNLEMFDSILKNTNGIILLTGPTGSGKSTTLYSALVELNKVNRNIVTVEDPVEYKLTGVNQVQVNQKAGLTFASGLRSILRQDPDVIMIGEIRDAETAQIAVRSAITGHLVLSTIHTNDAPSTISRIVDMGIEPFLVANSVVGIIAQRLVRKICDNCRVEYVPDEDEKTYLIEKDKKVFKGTGCKFCNGTGYTGRTAIHEVMVITKEIRNMINKGQSVDELRDMSRMQGTTSLKESCLDLVHSGITSVEELVKVTFNLD
jgi:type IV pilus assembly protein PilB